MLKHACIYFCLSHFLSFPSRQWCASPQLAFSVAIDTHSLTTKHARESLSLFVANFRIKIEPYSCIWPAVRYSSETFLSPAQKRISLLKYTTPTIRTCRNCGNFKLKWRLASGLIPRCSSCFNCIQLHDAHITNMGKKKQLFCSLLF